MSRRDVSTRRSVKDEIRDNLITRLRAQRAAVSRHHRLRRHGRAADRQRDPVAPQLHPARPARPGQEPDPARPHHAARRAVPVMPGCEIHDDPLAPLCAACRARVAQDGDDAADRLARSRRALRREAGHARRDDRRHDRRPRSDQGGARRPPALRRADDALRPAAARQPRHLRDQRAARPRRQDPGRPVQHPPGRGRPDQGLPGAPAARRDDGLQRQPRGLHRARQDHHAAEGPHRLGDPHALSGRRGSTRWRSPRRRPGSNGRGTPLQVPDVRARGRRGDRLPGARGQEGRQALGRQPAAAHLAARKRRLERRAARAAGRRRPRSCRGSPTSTPRCRRSPASSSSSTKASCAAPTTSPATSIRGAVGNVFTGYFAGADLRQVTEWFDLGGTLQVDDALPAAELLRRTAEVQGLQRADAPRRRARARPSRRWSPRRSTSSSRGCTRRRRSAGPRTRQYQGAEPAAPRHRGRRPPTEPTTRAGRRRSPATRRSTTTERPGARGPHHEIPVFEVHRRRSRRARSRGAAVEALGLAALERLRQPVRHAATTTISRGIPPGAARRDPGSAAERRHAVGRDARELLGKDWQQAEDAEQRVDALVQQIIDKLQRQGYLTAAPDLDSRDASSAQAGRRRARTRSTGRASRSPTRASTSSATGRCAICSDRSARAAWAATTRARWPPASRPAARPRSTSSATR